VIPRYDPTIHDVSTFDCGQDALTDGFAIPPAKASGATPRERSLPQPGKDG